MGKPVERFAPLTATREGARVELREAARRRFFVVRQ
jgi:hypothetical protein